MDWLAAVIELFAPLARWLFGRWLAPKQVSEGVYKAEKAEAKELAKPDRSYSDTVDRL